MKNFKINVQVIDHFEHRYETVGDWWFHNDTLEIRVSKLGDFYKEFCIALHEQIEAMLCLKRGISEKSVSEFDKEFEKRRLIKLETPDAEPGDSPLAPYRKEHFFSTSIERLTAAELEIDWTEYENEIYELPSLSSLDTSGSCNDHAE